MDNYTGILYFSPTGTTKTICTAAAEGMGAGDIQGFDMTLPGVRAAIIANPVKIFEKINHLIVGAPVYSGKLPLQVLECLSVISANAINSSAIVVYGNRDYGVALHTMVGVLLKNGFSVTAAGAFIGQHSYSDILPVAVGRPDESDLETARLFGTKSIHANRCLTLEDIPVQIDRISKSAEYTALKPAHIEKQCVQCGICAKRCPAGCLSIDTGRYLNRDAKKRCIGCLACVRSCLQKAKTLKANPVVRMMVKRILAKAATDRNEPTIIAA